MAEQPAFDPRFDPAFQRGYEPPVRENPPAPQPEAVVEVPASAAPLEVEESGQELQPDAPVNTATTLPAVRRGINPYVVILWVIGVIFALGGAALLFAGFLGLYAGGVAGPAQAMSAQILYAFGTTFGVPLVTVGLITIVGLIFVSAWHSWRRHDGVNS
jgi:hypothetical protein